jgi:hypothetical protein
MTSRDGACFCGSRVKVHSLGRMNFHGMDHMQLSGDCLSTLQVVHGHKSGEMGKKQHIVAFSTVVGGDGVGAGEEHWWLITNY